MEEKTVADKLHSSMPACGLPCSVQEIQIPGAQSKDVLNTEEYETKESVNLTPRVGEQTVTSLVPDEELRVKDSNPSPLTEIVGPIPTREEELTEEEPFEDEDDVALVALKIKFMRVLLGRDYRVAHKLCQMILIYEPENPEASEFLPLIQRLLEKAEQSDEEEDDSDTDGDDSGSEDESSQSSSCSSSSCSSSSPSDDDEEEETQSNRHEPCPPSHISP